MPFPALSILNEAFTYWMIRNTIEKILAPVNSEISSKISSALEIPLTEVGGSSPNITLRRETETTRGSERSHFAENDVMRVTAVVREF